MSVAVRPAAEDRAAGHAANGPAREHQRVAADFGAGVQLLDHTAKDGLFRGRQDIRGRFSQQTGFAAADLLRAAFGAGDDKVAIEEEHEIEGGKKRGAVALHVSSRQGLRRRLRRTRLGDGARAALFLSRQPANRSADSLEGAQLLGR